MSDRNEAGSALIRSSNRAAKGAGTRRPCSQCSTSFADTPSNCANTATLTPSRLRVARTSAGPYSCGSGISTSRIVTAPLRISRKASSNFLAKGPRPSGAAGMPLACGARPGFGAIAFIFSSGGYPPMEGIAREQRSGNSGQEQRSGCRSGPEAALRERGPCKTDILENRQIRLNERGSAVGAGEQAGGVAGNRHAGGTAELAVVQAEGP